MHLYGSQGATAYLSSTPLAHSSRWGCSLFAALGDPENQVYGRNFDWDYSPALLLFTYPEEGYASVSMVDLAYFFDDAVTQSLANLPLSAREPLLETSQWPFDGMNIHGLAVGMAAVPASRLPYSSERPTLGSLGVIRELLDHARTTEEAVQLMQSYNVTMEGGPPVHYLLADRTGRAALVEYFEGEIEILPNDGVWHAATNHYRAPLEATDSGGCWRYAALDRTLADRAGILDADDVMQLLADVSVSSTQWSVVYDMTTTTVRVTMGRDYEHSYTFDLEGGLR
jgi:hypothetical protein